MMVAAWVVVLPNHRKRSSRTRTFFAGLPARWKYLGQSIFGLLAAYALYATATYPRGITKAAVEPVSETSSVVSTTRLA
ncbi:MAG TPA: hypothetical protein EYP40_00830, partial [Chromatiales bacterium]|nr:hypothetical protein [Chromatiales bacterium]